MTKSIFTFVLLSLMSISFCTAGILTNNHENPESMDDDLKHCQMFITVKNKYKDTSNTHWLTFEVEGTYPVASDLTITATVRSGNYEKELSVILPQGTVDTLLEVQNIYHNEGYRGPGTVTVTPTQDHTYFYTFIIWK